MTLKVLIADPRDILRLGLQTILKTDEHISQIYEAKTHREVQNCLHTKEVDLVLIHQSLITKITDLPCGRFVIVSPRLDIPLFRLACKHRARGYLLESASADLLKIILSLPEGTFFIEPSITFDVLEIMSGNTCFVVEDTVLTPREKEVVGLLKEGTDRRTIAKYLNITETTLKTHIKNITQKCG